VMKAMLLTKLKVVGTVLLAVTVAGIVTGFLTRPVLAQNKPAGDDSGQPAAARPVEDEKAATITLKNVTIQAVNAGQSTITVSFRKASRMAGKNTALARADAATEDASYTANQAKWEATVQLKKNFEEEYRMYFKLWQTNAGSASDMRRSRAQYDKSVADVAAAAAVLRQHQTWLENVTVAADAKIVVGWGAAPKLSDLIPGTRVSVRLASNGEQFIVTDIIMSW